MARVGACEPPPVGRAASYATSSTLPSPAIWTVHGSTLSPSYAVSGAGVGYDGPMPASVIALSDTRSMTTSRVPPSGGPAQHAYYEITVSSVRALATRAVRPGHLHRLRRGLVFGNYLNTGLVTKRPHE
ncbi:hypothetical protein V5799_012319 [Amblyomma americanum]|uniref:Uncharacterized protein n=1 Tax=Amblyomma americanum TaxID=6943 RepID=A0AAQ4EES5_AMBAM